MSKKVNIKFCNLVLLLAISILSSIMFVFSLATAMVASGTSLELTATLDKDRYVLGEPVILTVRLRNTGTTSVNVPDYLDPKEGTIAVRVSTPKGAVFAYVPLTVVCSDSAPVALKPGDVAGGVFPIFYGARGWTFSKPGSYKIAVSFKAEGKKGVINRAKPLILVVSDDKAGGLIVKKGISSSEAGKFLLWQAGDHLHKGIALLKSMIEKYPDSVLAYHARFALGKSLSRHFKDYSTKKIRLPDYKKSLDYLKKVKAEKLPRYLRVQHNLAQAKCYTALKQPEPAKELVAETKKLIADRPELQRFDTHIAQINRRLK
ncbi:MAG: tetratricopeptide repeat protein [Planctomycetota bacterium]